MSVHDSEDDFLDKMYQQSAQEKPPVDLDKHILELAKAKQQGKHFTMTKNVQQILSVAAVMMLSVYIVFDVNRDYPNIMDEGRIQPEYKNHKSAPSLERLQISDEAQTLKRMLKEDATAPAAKDSMNYMSDDISELASEAPIISQQKRQEPTPAEAMLDEIRQLLVVDKVQEAKLVYGKFKRLFPDYPVPGLIRDAIESQK